MNKNVHLYTRNCHIENKLANHQVCVPFPLVVYSFRCSSKSYQTMFHIIIIFLSIWIEGLFEHLNSNWFYRNNWVWLLSLFYSLLPAVVFSHWIWIRVWFMINNFISIIVYYMPYKFHVIANQIWTFGHAIHQLYRIILKHWSE